MNISKTFMVSGTIFLIVGMVIGFYMGVSRDHTLTPVHAHVNLLGFALMSIFGLTCHLVPATGTRGLAKMHDWLQVIGTALLLLLLTMFLTGNLEKTSPVFLLAPVCALAIIAGVVMYLWNLVRNFS